MIYRSPKPVFAILLATSTAAAQPPTASFAPVAEAEPVATFPIPSPPAAEPARSHEIEPASYSRHPPSPARARRHDSPISSKHSPVEADSSPEVRSTWMLSAEGMTHAPIDVGAQSILEMPIGLRIGGGIGWMPRPYLDLLSNVAHLATESELSPRFESGRALRVQVGMRPFHSFGGYVDAGYAHVVLESRVTDPTRLASSYELSSTLDLWFAEIGYQSLIADRVVIGFGFGITAVLGARTKTSASADPAASKATDDVDSTLERYGYIPTLTLRLGLDLI